MTKAKEENTVGKGRGELLSGKVSLRRCHTLSPWRRQGVICADTGGEPSGDASDLRMRTPLFPIHLMSWDSPEGDHTAGMF